AAPNGGTEESQAEILPPAYDMQTEYEYGGLDIGQPYAGGAGDDDVTEIQVKTLERTADENIRMYFDSNGNPSGIVFTSDGLPLRPYSEIYEHLMGMNLIDSDFNIINNPGGSDAEGNSTDMPYHILVPQPNGTFIEVDRFNVPYGMWEWDEETEEFIFLEFEVMPLAMWRWDDEKDEWLLIDFRDPPLGWWVFDDENGDWNFIQFGLLDASNSPNTGDRQKGAAAALITLLISLAGFAVLVFIKKRLINYG
ncbi:MAG: hypothetical protein FWE82_05380, partial [Defluviitaleaceae bacterium]|nr:hypothetical protein [Defluviitaleaceae bacterium]